LAKLPEEVILRAKVKSEEFEAAIEEAKAAKRVQLNAVGCAHSLADTLCSRTCDDGDWEQAFNQLIGST
jgi:hypothetical protein